MSEQTTPRTPEQRPRGIAPRTPQGQRTRAQATNAPRRRVPSSLSLDDEEDEDEDERRRNRQNRFREAMGTAAGTEPGPPPLMNVPELKL